VSGIFTILQLEYGKNTKQLALVLRPGQVSDTGFAVQVVHLLMGNHPEADRLLNHEIKPGTVLEQMGAKNFLTVCSFSESPSDLVEFGKLLNRFAPMGMKVVLGGGGIESWRLAEPQSGSVYGVAIAMVKNK